MLHVSTVTPPRAASLTHSPWLTVSKCGNETKGQMAGIESPPFWKKKQKLRFRKWLKFEAIILCEILLVMNQVMSLDCSGRFCEPKSQNTTIEQCWGSTFFLLGFSFCLTNSSHGVILSSRFPKSPRSIKVITLRTASQKLLVSCLNDCKLASQNHEQPLFSVSIFNNFHGFILIQNQQIYKTWIRISKCSSSFNKFHPGFRNFSNLLLFFFSPHRRRRADWSGWPPGAQPTVGMKCLVYVSFRWIELKQDWFILKNKCLYHKYYS